MSRIRSRIERLERVTLPAAPAEVSIVRRIVGADGDFTGEEIRWDSETREEVFVFNEATAGKRAPGVTTPDEARVTT